MTLTLFGSSDCSGSKTWHQDRLVGFRNSWIPQMLTLVESESVGLVETCVSVCRSDGSLSSF